VEALAVVPLVVEVVLAVLSMMLQKLLCLEPTPLPLVLVVQQLLKLQVDTQEKILSFQT
jgi:hypothetical protein